MMTRFGGEYGRKVTWKDILQRARNIPGLTGLELNGASPGLFINEKNYKEIGGDIRDAGLTAVGVHPDITSGQFYKGSFASPDKQIRELAVEKFKTWMDISKELRFPCGVGYFIGNDGFEYYLSSDYVKAWERLIESFREVTKYRPEVNVFITFKIRNPRRRQFISSFAKTLLLIKEIGAKNLGVDLDNSHAFMGRENMAECLALMKTFGLSDRLFHVCIDDSSELDCGLIAGSINTAETVEFLIWLDRLPMSWNGWISVEPAPYREDPTEAITQDIKMIEGLYRAISQVGIAEINKVIERGDSMQGVDLLRKILTGA